MSGEQKRSDAPLIALTVILALICAAGGWLLLFGRQPASEQTDSAEQTTSETVTVPPQTTVSSSGTKPIPTVTTPTDHVHKPYYAYLENTLLPEYGLADSSAAASGNAMCGIADVFFDDLRETGTDDMVVICLESVGDSGPAMPVFLWYGESDGEVTLLDSFEVKPKWSAYCIRREGGEICISGEYLDENGDAENWRFTEMQLVFQPEADLVMPAMETGTASERPAPYYSESAEILLEMQLDTAYPIAPLTERRYLLRSEMPADIYYLLQ